MKGKTNNPNGRPKGIANKSTQEARAAIAAFVEGNIDRLNGWLEEIAAESPKDAFDRLMAVVEYHIPKLARVESDVNNRGSLTVQVVKLSDNTTTSE